MSKQRFEMEVDMTPEQLAGVYWSFDSKQQADFFAALERMAGVKLCLQHAYVVDEIAERASNGDHDAQNGFQTMLAHAQGYRDSATQMRTWRAKREISRMAEAVRRELGLNT